MANVWMGKKIWLIGASEGIGEAVARQLAGAGAQVALSARSKDKLEALAASLPGAGHMAVPLDVTDGASMHRGWDAVKTRWGEIDTVIYNAGTYVPMSAKAFELAQAEQMVNVNFSGTLRMLDCILPAFLAHRRGHIVLVGSVAGYQGLPRAIGYGASKAAVKHLAENLHIDLSGTGIKVQVVSPGFVKTRLTDKNEFKMPFIIEAEDAARRIVKGMEGHRFEIHFPRRFSMILKTLGMLPRCFYLRIASSL